MKRPVDAVLASEDTLHVALLDLLVCLGELRDDVVLVGGLVPELVIRLGGTRYVVTADIDLAVPLRSLTQEQRDRLLTVLNESGFQQDEGQPYRFVKDVKEASGQPVRPVIVDILTGEASGVSSETRTQHVVELCAMPAPGCDLAFEYWQEMHVSVALPDGSTRSRTIKVAGPEAWLPMKGMVLHTQRSPKDAYDIYYYVRNFEGGPEELVRLLRPCLTNETVAEGLRKIKGKFGSPADWGPKAAAEEAERYGSPEDPEQTARRAFEEISLLLDPLGLSPWPGH